MLPRAVGKGRCRRSRQDSRHRPFPGIALLAAVGSPGGPGPGHGHGHQLGPASRVRRVKRCRPAGFVVSSNAGQQGSSCQTTPASRVRRVKQCRPAGVVVSSCAGQQGSSCQAMPASRVSRVKQCRQLSSAPREVLAFGRWCDRLSRWQLFTVFELVHDTREVVFRSPRGRSRCRPATPQARRRACLDLPRLAQPSCQ